MSPCESFELSGFDSVEGLHLTEMTQWQLNCNQDISSVNMQMREQGSAVFTGHTLYSVCVCVFFFRSFGFAEFCNTHEITHLLLLSKGIVIVSCVI